SPTCRLWYSPASSLVASGSPGGRSRVVLAGPGQAPGLGAEVAVGDQPVEALQLFDHAQRVGAVLAGADGEVAAGVHAVLEGLDVAADVAVAVPVRAARERRDTRRLHRWLGHRLRDRLRRGRRRVPAGPGQAPGLGAEVAVGDQPVEALQLFDQAQRVGAVLAGADGEVAAGVHAVLEGLDVAADVAVAVPVRAARERRDARRRAGRGSGRDVDVADAARSSVRVLAQAQDRRALP